MPNVCTHLDAIADVTPSSTGCEDCLRIGGRWVHLRLCMSCGHVACCDNSPNRHATAHFSAHHEHPIIRSYEPGEDWWYCYEDDLAFDVPDAPPRRRIPEQVYPEVQMDDHDIMQRISTLIDEEHTLEQAHTGEALSADDKTRLDSLEVALDQCWDLLRQRRARRNAGQDADSAHARPEDVVERYQQ